MARWADGLYAVNYQAGFVPSLVQPDDVDGDTLLYVGGTEYNPTEGDTITLLVPGGFSVQYGQGWIVE